MRPERRHSVRLTIPPQAGGPGLGRHQVRLLDLSPEGARVEHVHPFPDGYQCVLDLPPATHVTYRCDLDPEAARIYRDLEEDFVARVLDGTVTAASSSGINDGAAALLVTDKANKPIARIVTTAVAGVDPRPVRGTGCGCAAVHPPERS